MPRIPLPRLVFILLASLLLSSCALFANRDPLNVQVAGIEPLPGEGLELRLALKLRVQNPNTSAVAYDGLALSLEVNGRELASGVSDQRGEVPRFGERLITVPMTLSAFAWRARCWAWPTRRRWSGCPTCCAANSPAEPSACTASSRRARWNWATSGRIGRISTGPEGLPHPALRATFSRREKGKARRCLLPHAPV